MLGTALFSLPLSRCARLTRPRGHARAASRYVLFRNIEQAQADGDEKLASVLVHLHTRLQEELESRTEPALALLHKLTRTDDAPLRGRILRHFLLPQKAIKLPDGSEMPMKPGAKAATSTVSPDEFSAAVVDTLGKIEQLPVDRAMLVDTAEGIRQVAKEARGVIADGYSEAELDAFSEALQPAFTRLMR